MLRKTMFALIAVAAIGLGTTADVSARGGGGRGHGGGGGGGHGGGGAGFMAVKAVASTAVSFAEAAFAGVELVSVATTAGTGILSGMAPTTTTMRADVIWSAGA
jgi:hypothetical protein